ncbi:MAG: hypothetical protein PVH47_05720 [Thiohalocapsa sp.]|jgi:hypothetical protein
MHLPRIHYRVVGQDDYMLIIDVSPDGSFSIDSGDYVSHRPVRGSVDDAHRKRLEAALRGLAAPREHAAPEGATGFMAELTVGDGAAARHYRFWEGAMDEEPDLKALVRALESLG